MEDQTKYILSHWNKIPSISSTINDVEMDLSDGVAVAEFAQHFLGDLVDLKDYAAARTYDEKLRNWRTLRDNVFSQLGMDVGDDTLLAIVGEQPGAVQNLTELLQVEINNFTGTDAPSSASHSFDQSRTQDDDNEIERVPIVGIVDVYAGRYSAPSDSPFRSWTAQDDQGDEDDVYPMSRPSRHNHPTSQTRVARALEPYDAGDQGVGSADADAEDEKKVADAPASPSAMADDPEEDQGDTAGLADDSLLQDFQELTEAEAVAERALRANARSPQRGSAPRATTTKGNTPVRKWRAHAARSLEEAQRRAEELAREDDEKEEPFSGWLSNAKQHRVHPLERTSSAAREPKKRKPAPSGVALSKSEQKEVDMRLAHFRDLLSPKYVAAMEAFEDVVRQQRSSVLQEEQRKRKLELDSLGSIEEKRRVSRAHNQELRELDAMLNKEFVAHKQKLEANLTASMQAKTDQKEREIVAEILARRPASSGPTTNGRSPIAAAVNNSVLSTTEADAKLFDTSLRVDENYFPPVSPAPGGQPEAPSPAKPGRPRRSKSTQLVKKALTTLRSMLKEMERGTQVLRSVVQELEVESSSKGQPGVSAPPRVSVSRTGKRPESRIKISRKRSAGRSPASSAPRSPESRSPSNALQVPRHRHRKHSRSARKRTDRSASRRRSARLTKSSRELEDEVEATWDSVTPSKEQEQEADRSMHYSLPTFSSLVHASPPPKPRRHSKKKKKYRSPSSKPSKSRSGSSPSPYKAQVQANVQPAPTRRARKKRAGSARPTRKKGKRTGSTSGSTAPRRNSSRRTHKQRSPAAGATSGPTGGARRQLTLDELKALHAETVAFRENVGVKSPSQMQEALQRMLRLTKPLRK